MDTSWPVRQLRRAVRAHRIAARITMLNLRARMEYRANFIMSVVGGIMWQISVLVFASVLLVRFPGMGGWSSRDVLLLASMRLLSHGLFVLILGRTAWLGSIVEQGTIDSYLLRPLPVYRQVQLSFFNTNSIGDLIVAVTLFAYAIAITDIAWTPLRAGYLAAAVVGGVLMEGAIYTTVSAAAFHAPATGYWLPWLDELMTAFGNYPLHILPRLICGVLTYLLPLGFVAYLPAAVLTGHAGTIQAPWWLATAAPLVGLVAFVASRRLWSLSLRHYKGA